jgi:uncharacterized protein
MSKHDLPEYFEIEKLCREEAQFSGSVHLSTEGHLADLIAAEHCDLEVSLSFKRDPRNYRVISGSFKGHIPLICQRCLEPYVQEITAEWFLSPVHSLESVQGLSEDYEPLFLKEREGKDGCVSLRDLLEEELILSLPLVPRHEEGLCG